MQQVSATYTSLLSSTHTVESKLEVWDKDGTNLIHTFNEQEISSMSTTRGLFANDTPSVGGTVSCEIDCELYVGDVAIPRMAMLKPYVRLTNGTTNSEWLPKGVYWIDTRSTDYSSGKMTINGYDAMLKGETQFAPEQQVQDWPRTDLQVLNGYTISGRHHDGIAQKLGVTIQQSTLAMINKGYQVQFPGTVQGDDENVKGAAYTVREVLSYIGAMYCGSWTIDEDGTLRLVKLKSAQADTNYLITENGEAITFGGTRILVG